MKKNLCKILLVEYLFPPIGGSESIVSAKTALALAEANFELTVVTASSRTSQDGTDHSLDKYLDHPNIRHIELPAYENKYLLGFLNRTPFGLGQLPDCKISWRHYAIKFCNELLKKEHFDLLYTRSHYISSQIVGLALTKNNNIPWVAHFSDPWTDNPYEHYKNTWVEKRNLYLEEEVLKRADYITYTSPYTLSNEKKRYPEVSKKMGISYHCYDARLYGKAVKVKLDVKSINIGHIGSFYGKRSCKPLLEAIHRIMIEDAGLLKDISFSLLGYMSNSERKLCRPLAEAGIVRILPSVNYLQSLEFMQKMDVLLVVDAPGSNSQFFPSKLVDYIGSDRYIFGITPRKGMSTDLIKKLGGAVADPIDIDGIFSELTHIIKKAKQNDLPTLNQTERKNFDIKEANIDLIRQINHLQNEKS